MIFKPFVRLVDVPEVDSDAPFCPAGVIAAARRHHAVGDCV